ncbi:uncharacterized protein LOC124277128 [Haliotis rubra]|uniref:uncharacterized protein LOC124277128 n=1 Tax=Haliotis rubra TaxID=36100 RepID=UPI001EE61944|nr:uncharacterized protein LOC124277128 [Haliotis rubra]
MFKLRSRRRAESKRRYPNNEFSTLEAVPLTENQLGAEQPEADQFESPGNEDTHKIVPDIDKQPTDQPSREKDISDLFVETEGYRKVKDKLETLGHVTISGGPGEGKTSTALMLGAEYRRQGYEVVLVEDVGTFQLSDCLCKGKDVCVIFDDIFQNVGPSMDVHRLRQVLYELHGHLEPWKTKLERRYNILQQTPGTEQRRKDRLNLYFIFTTDSNNLEQARPKLKEPILFQNSSVVDLTKLMTGEEKKAIWLKHKDHYDCKTEVNVNIIIAYEERVGFPLACKLFTRYAPFKTQRIVFEMPKFHLKQELHKNINHLDDQSVIFLLRSLCGGEQNTRKRHTGSDNKIQDTHLKDVSALVSCSNIPLIQNMWMSAILNTNPELFLHNCSLKFIWDHVRDQQHDTAPAEQTVIYFPGAHSDVITARLAEAVADGTFSNYIMHPIWKMKEVADKVNQMFPDDGTKSHDTKHGILHYACFMGNNDIIDRLLPHCDINRRAVNGWTPVMFAVAGGQMDSLKLLVVHKADITLCDAMNNNLLHLAWRMDVFDLVSQNADLSLTDDDNNSLLHLACLLDDIPDILLTKIDADIQGNHG